MQITTANAREWTRMGNADTLTPALFRTRQREHSLRNARMDANFLNAEFKRGDAEGTERNHECTRIDTIIEGGFNHGLTRINTDEVIVDCGTRKIDRLKPALQTWSGHRLKRALGMRREDRLKAELRTWKADGLKPALQTRKDDRLEPVLRTVRD